jgi:hypothetical protein
MRVGLGIDRGVGNDPITPTARIRGETERRPRAHLPRPANGQGYRGQSTPGYPRPRFKRVSGRRIANAKPPTPLGFSPLRHLRLSRERRERGRRRAAPEEGGREPAGDEDPGNEEPELRRTATGVNTYPTYVHLFTEPATTTPPPYREHRPATLMSSPPWSSSCDGSATSRCVTS